MEKKNMVSCPFCNEGLSEEDTIRDPPLPVSTEPGARCECPGCKALYWLRTSAGGIPFEAEGYLGGLTGSTPTQIECKVSKFVIPDDPKKRVLYLVFARRREPPVYPVHPS